VKLATYNVNGVNGRLEVLHGWMRPSRTSSVCRT